MRPIAILDSSPPDHLAPLVEALDECGFARYWATEHYGNTQSASPVLLATLAAGLTKNMRVGTAGVLLRMTSAIRVAADFAALELYFPGRIDLGIAGATPPEVAERIAVDTRVANDVQFEDRIVRVLELLDPQAARIGPPRETTPQVWLCGSSLRGATIAARLGLNFAFHAYIAKGVTALDAAAVYRREFVAKQEGARPYFVVAGLGGCAPTRAAAREQWRGHFGASSDTDPGLPTPTFIGDPEECKDQLAALCESCGADEVAIDVLTPDFESRLEGLTSLAKVWLA